MEELVFDKDFLFGAATASYQIEGAAWANGRGVSIWDTFCRTPGKVYNGDNGDTACDHYHRYEEDLDLMKDLGVGSYRFSIAWPRIFPSGYGKVEERGIDFYDRLLDAILKRDLKPNATLYHWDLPQTLEDEGGWFTRSTAEHFATYAETILKRIGDRLAMVSTFNEPWCSSFLGYLIGDHAPGKRNRTLFAHAVHHLNLAHGLTIPVIRSLAPKAKAGIVLNLNQNYPATDTAEDCEARMRHDHFHNGVFLGPLFEEGYPADVVEALAEDLPKGYLSDLTTIKQPLDYIGVNYYSSEWIKAAPGEFPGAKAVPKGLPVTGMGWEIHPNGLCDLLLRLTRAEYVPEIYITENGSAWPDEPPQEGEVHDAERCDYLVKHLVAVREAIDAGAPVKGYYAWSILDNFEWAYGYDKRFGLVYVDYKTQERTLKDSAKKYKEIIQKSVD